MRQNNETILARHTPHSTHCLKRLNSLNCLIKSVKTLQMVIKLTILLLLCSHKLSSLDCLDLSLTLNIAIIYCSFIVKRRYFNLCSLAVNIHSSYLFMSLKFTACTALVNCVQMAQETHLMDGSCQQNSMNCLIRLAPSGGPSSPKCVLCLCVNLFACAHTYGKGVHGHSSQNRLQSSPL